MKLLLYCTKAKPYLIHMPKDEDELAGLDINNSKLNGKIVAECDFEVEEIKYRYDTSAYRYNNINDYYYTNTLNFTQLEKRSCLTNKDLLNYLGQNGGYAIHIKNLHIFDSPVFLESFDDNKGHTLRKAPKNMCKVLRVNIGEYDYQDLNSNAYEPCILISLKPQEMCRIANKEQTTLVRRVVLKEMLE